jgi:hypothetical protein
MIDPIRQGFVEINHYHFIDNSSLLDGVFFFDGAARHGA